MSVIRTLISAVCILAGALLIVGWAVSSLAERTVQDGTALVGIAESAFDIPGVVNGMSRQVQDQTLEALAGEGVDPSVIGVDDEVRGAVDGIVHSALFEEAVLAEVEAAQDEFFAKLTSPTPATQPLTLEVDVSSLVNARIDDIGSVATLAPDVSVAPAEIEVLSAERMADAQTGYRWMERLAAWGLWAGLACLVIGVLVSHRRRWFAAKALIAIGVIALGFGVVVRFVDPSAVAGVLPGSHEGVLGTLWVQWVVDDSAAGIATRAMLIGGVSLAVGVLIAALTRAARSHR